MTPQPVIPEIPKFENKKVILDFSQDDGMIVEIEPAHFITSISHGIIKKSIPTVAWSYYGNNGNTFSGPYVFNPLKQP